MKKLLKLGLIIAGTAALSLTIANAINPPHELSPKCQNGKCSSGKCSGGKHTQKKDYNITKPAPAKGKCGQGKCGSK